MALLTKSGFVAMETNGFIFMLHHHRKNWYGRSGSKCKQTSIILSGGASVCFVSLRQILWAGFNRTEIIISPPAMHFYEVDHTQKISPTLITWNFCAFFLMVLLWLAEQSLGRLDTCTELLQQVELLQCIVKHIVFYRWLGIMTPWLSIIDIAKHIL